MKRGQTQEQKKYKYNQAQREPRRNLLKPGKTQ